MKIVIIDYGAGNIQSIIFAFKRLGYEPVLSSNADEIQLADKVIFPGVGEAGSAMKKLRESGLDKIIPSLKQPVLGICLGMQLMCNGSEEGDTKGLGVFNVNVVRFNNEVKVPQIGWNQVSHPEAPFFNGVKNNEYMYLVHSYYAPLCENTIATADYGRKYSVALQKGNFYGVQFHPEKSSIAGERLLKNFLNL